MKFVYQTKLSGSIEAPIVPKISAFALKAAAVCRFKTNIYGIVLGDEIKKIPELVKKTGAKFTRKGMGVSITPSHDAKMSFKKIFAEEIKGLPENAFELSEITVSGETDILLACILGDILFGNSQTITVSSPVEDPEMLCEALKIIGTLGGSVNFENETILVSNKTAMIGSEKLYVDGDWSIGAFGLMAKAIGYDVSVNNLFNRNSAQKFADIVKPLQQMGMRIIDEPKGRMVLESVDYKRAVKIDAAICPNSLPYLLFLATQIDGETEVYNLTKEIVEANDKALFYTVAELKRLGFEVTPSRAGTIGICGRKVFEGGVKINCHNNFTVAMVGILATLCSRKSNILENCEIVEEKYPDFWEWYTNIGGFVE